MGIRRIRRSRPRARAAPDQSAPRIPRRVQETLLKTHRRAVPGGVPPLRTGRGTSQFRCRRLRLPLGGLHASDRPGLRSLPDAVEPRRGCRQGPLVLPHPGGAQQANAVGYLATMIVEVVLLAVGVLSLLMIVPLAEQAADAGPAGAGWAQALGSLAVEANTMAY